VASAMTPPKSPTKVRCCFAQSLSRDIRLRVRVEHNCANTDFIATVSMALERWRESYLSPLQNTEANSG